MKTWWLALVMVLFAGSASAALHDDGDFETATHLYRELQYEQALLVFERLSVQPAYTAEERAEVLVWAALCAEGIGDAAGADRLMKEALLRDVEVKLPVKASPRTTERLEELRAEAKVAAAKAAPVADPVPAPAPVVKAPPSTEASVPVVPAVLGGGAAVALAATGVLAWLAADRYALATNAELFADERAGHYGEHVGAFTGAVVLGVVGAGLAGTAAVLALGGPSSSNADATRSEP